MDIMTPQWDQLEAFEFLTDLPRDVIDPKLDFLRATLQDQNSGFWVKLQGLVRGQESLG
jgi:hypothetical protein